MKFTREISSVTTIRRVSGKAIVIGENRYTETIALTPDGLVEDFAPPPLEELGLSHFEMLLEDEPELVILGTGDRTVFPPRELTFAFARRNIGLEVMNTAAAARTFNVLAGEGRRLAAVFYI
ncbi:MAG: Mth938-like domain-containing protein [Gammaproteobacteria bacterium]|nr:Mth938-like domain-containing protein [Gammaproteobacteria bacterium]MDH3759174.1 Mth938-like domain-containing protein [Gammaproteobacteria bacterium]MDH3846903.1 Mth938-like domain-containing protein [Gammaproteobacteria bacterium]MDH3863857.1 Mth938-like domain-containing protein [Gammaproteobacteria bacterium]MDH3904788.1 Mth938-like domain-containing protein [Gammaproteobacteria bacterium]